MTIKDLVKDRTVSFQYFREGVLVYQVNGTSFRFTIPVEETGTGTFDRDDRAIYYMRWIRKTFEAQNGSTV